MPDDNMSEFEPTIERNIEHQDYEPRLGGVFSDGRSIVYSVYRYNSQNRASELVIRMSDGKTYIIAFPMELTRMVHRCNDAAAKSESFAGLVRYCGHSSVGIKKHCDWNAELLQELPITECLDTSATLD